MATSEDVAEVVRTQRASLRLSQQQVATTAGVTRQFVSDLENGHPRAELGKMLAVLSALQVHALAIPTPPPDTSSRTIHDMTGADLDAHLARYANAG